MIRTSPGSRLRTPAALIALVSGLVLAGCNAPRGSARTGHALVAEASPIDILARDATDSAGVAIGPAGLSGADHGDWAAYPVEVDFGPTGACRYNRFSAVVATPADGNVIELRLGAPDGPVAARMPTRKTGPDFSTFAELRTQMPFVRGRHAIFVRFDGSANRAACQSACQAPQSAECAAAQARGCGSGIGTFTSFRIEPATEEDSGCLETPQPAPAAPQIVITAPTGRPFLLVAEEAVRLEGSAVGLGTLSWKSGTVEGAATVEDGRWRIDLAVPAGRTVVELRGSSASGQVATARLLVSRVPGLLATGDAVLGRAAIMEGETEALTLGVPLAGDAALLAGLRLGVAPKGAAYTDVGALRDDGQAGDAAAGDGIFTARFVAAAFPIGPARLAVLLGSGTARQTAPVAALEVTPRIGPAEVARLEAVLADLSQASASATAPTEESVQAELLARARANPEVELAVIPAGSRSLSVVVKPGLLGVVVRGDPDSRGTHPEIGNRRAFLGRAYAAEISGAEITEAKAAWEEEKKTHPEIAVETFFETDLTIEKVRQMPSYGFIAVASHGEVYATRGSALLVGEAGGVTPESAQGSLVFVGESPSDVAARYPAELAAFQVALVTWDTGTQEIRAAFTDRLISTLPRFADSFVYLGACHSSTNGAFWKAFSSRGAKGFFGYNISVQKDAADEIGSKLLRCLITKKDAAGEPLTYGACLEELHAGNDLPVEHLTKKGVVKSCTDWGRLMETCRLQSFTGPDCDLVQNSRGIVNVVPRIRTWHGTLAASCAIETFYDANSATRGGGSGGGSGGGAAGKHDLVVGLGAGGCDGQGDDLGACALAEAMVTNLGDLVGARFVSHPGSGTPHAVSPPLGPFPTSGGDFAIMTSGNAGLAATPNDDGEAGVDLGKAEPARGPQAYDVSVLELTLRTPPGANCLRLDFAYFSEEFPEFVGGLFNDAFIAELDQSTWTTNEDTEISAPGNFAYDDKGHVVSVNSTGLTSMTVANAAGTTYDGGTTRLRAATPIGAGETHKLYLSILDQGDGVLDSAVFIDNVRFESVANVATDCKPGAQ